MKVADRAGRVAPTACARGVLCFDMTGLHVCALEAEARGKEKWAVCWPAQRGQRDGGMVRVSAVDGSKGTGRWSMKRNHHVMEIEMSTKLLNNNLDVSVTPIEIQVPPFNAQTYTGNDQDNTFDASVE